MKKMMVGLCAVLPGFALADQLSDHVKQLEQKVQALESELASVKALRIRLEEIEKRDLALPPGTQNGAGVKPLQTVSVESAPPQVESEGEKTNQVISGFLDGLSITGYVDPSYVMNRNQKMRQFLFLNREGYTYDNSNIGDIYLNIKKTFGTGLRAPNVEFQIMPTRGDGVYALGSDPQIQYKPHVFNLALATLPISDTTAVTAGFMPGFAGYEYMQSNLMLTMSHNLLYDFSMTGDFTGVGLNYTKGDWAWKGFIGNEEYHTASTALPDGKRNRVPTLTGRFDYALTPVLSVGGSFSWGKNTLANNGNSYGQDLPHMVFNDGVLAGCAEGFYGTQCTSRTPFTSKFYSQLDFSYVLDDMQFNGQLDYGNYRGGAWNGQNASWYGVSMLAHRKMELALLGRAGATVRVDYLNNSKNGGGGGTLFMPNGSDGLNGFGVDPQCLRYSTLGGIGCSGANRWALTTTFLLYPTEQITLKAEYRYDRATLPVFINADGGYVRSNSILGAQFIYSF